MLIFIIIAILIYFALSMCIYKEKITLPKIRNYNKSIHDKLRPLLKKVVDFFNKYNITYWIFGGTLLGYVRHDKKFIPHDDDIDLVIYGENIHQTFKNFEKNKVFEENGLRIEEHFFGYKIFDINDNSNTFIDLFVYSKFGDKLDAETEYTRNIFPTHYFIENELFPLKKDTFENVEVNIPKEPEKYLFHSYGPDCLKVVKYDFPHYDHLNFIDKISLYF